MGWRYVRNTGRGKNSPGWRQRTRNRKQHLRNRKHQQSQRRYRTICPCQREPTLNLFVWSFLLLLGLLTETMISVGQAQLGFALQVEWSGNNRSHRVIKWYPLVAPGSDTHTHTHIHCGADVQGGLGVWVICQQETNQGKKKKKPESKHSVPTHKPLLLTCAISRKPWSWLRWSQHGNIVTVHLKSLLWELVLMRDHTANKSTCFSNYSHSSLILQIRIKCCFSIS